MLFDVLCSGRKQLMAHWRCNGRIPNIDGRWAPPFGLVFRCFPPSLVVEWNATLASPHIQRLEVFWANAENCGEYSIYQSYIISIYAYILYLTVYLFKYLPLWPLCEWYSEVTVSPKSKCVPTGGATSHLERSVIESFVVFPCFLLPSHFFLRALCHFDCLLLTYLPCLRGTAFCRFSTTGPLGT